MIQSRRTRLPPPQRRGHSSTMATLTFDTRKLTRKREAAGFTRDQAAGAAEAPAETQRESLDAFATKADIADFRRDLRKTTLRLEAKIEGVRGEIQGVRAEIVKWMFGAMAAQTGLIVALLKLLP